MKPSQNFWFVLGIVAIALLFYAFYVQRQSDIGEAEYDRQMQEVDN